MNYKKLLAILTLLLLVFPPGLIAAPGMARSAGAIWDLDESSGTRYDSVTQGVGPSAQFTSANSEYLSIADNAALSTGDISFTIAAWVYLDSKSSQMSVMSRRNGGTTSEYDLTYYAAPTDHLRFETLTGAGGGAGEIWTGSLALGTWHFIVAWRDTGANTVNIQANDGSVNSTSITGAISDTAASFRIGAINTTPSTFWNGRIQNVGFWKKALSASERTELYNSGKGYAYRDLSASLKTSLISYWNLNESAGVRFDSQGTNHLLDNNTVTQAAGVRTDNTVGRAGDSALVAAQFTAANVEYLSITDNAELSMGAGVSFSFTAWVYADSLGNNRRIIAKAIAAPNREYEVLFDTTTNRFTFSVSSDGTNMTAVAANNFGLPSTGTWYFIAAWFDNSANTIKISVNNGTADSASFTLDVVDAGAAFRIGTAGTAPIAGDSWDGRIQLVGFWKKALSDAERTMLYNAGKGLLFSELTDTLTTTLISYWNLNEPSGTRKDAVTTTPNDLTDNATVTQSAGVRTTQPPMQAAGRGKSSIAGQFTAANSEYLEIPDNAALSTGDITYTIACWVYKDSTLTDGQHRSIIRKGPNEYLLVLSDTDAGVGVTERFRFSHDSVTTDVVVANTFGTPANNTWYLVIGTHRGGASDQIGIQVNNGTEDTVTAATPPSDSTNAVGIGANAGTGANPWNGRVAKCGFWKKDLSATERTDLYNSGRGNSYDGAAFYKDTAGTLKTSLQAWWELDELCCTRFDKVSPGVGPAAQFTAANLEYLSKTDNADSSTGNIDFSFSVWMYPLGLSVDEYIAGKYDSNPNLEWYLRKQSDNSARFTVSTTTGGASCNLEVANTFISANQWYHIFIWRDVSGQTINMKVNDGSLNSTPCTLAMGDGGSAFEIGRITLVPTTFFNGRIQLAGFWKRLLTSAEITTLYNSGSGRHCKDLNDQLRRKLISYWNLNEGSGTRYDCVGANDLTDNATVTQATGVAGGNSLGDNATVTHQQGLPWWTKARASGQFVRANSEYLSVVDNADVSVGTSNFTWAAWVWFDSDVDEMIVNKSLAAGNQREYLLDRLGPASGSRLRFCVSSDGTDHVCVQDTNFGVTTTNTWYFVVGWSDNTGNQIAIQTNNGTPTTATFTGAGFDSTTPLNIGRDPDGLIYDGRIDEVGFWKKALTAQERADLYNSGKANRYNGNSFEVDTAGTLTTNLVAYWTLDEASGRRYDSKGANHLDDNNTVTQNVGIDGTASGQFVRANSEYLSIPDNAALSTGDIDFTAAAWVYIDGSLGGSELPILARNVGGTDTEYVLDIQGACSGDPFEFGVYASGGGNSFACDDAVAKTGIWYFVVGWHDSVEDAVYVQVNNAAPTRRSTTVTPSDTTAATHIGRHTASAHFDGRIDQAMVFKRVLTESERAALYNQGAGVNYGRIQKGFKKRGVE